jgi:hypothetical protein
VALVAAVVFLGNALVLLGGGLAGWTLAGRDKPAPVLAAQPGVNPQIVEIGRSVDSKASKEDLGRVSADLVALARRVEALQTKIGELTIESARLNSRLEVAPRVVMPPPPDLKPLEGRLDRLAQGAKSVDSVRDDVHTLAERLAALDKTLNGVRSDVSALSSQVKEAVTPRPAAPAANAAPEPKRVNPVDEALARAKALFREGRFVEARDICMKLSAEHPDDARIWYVSALASGLATGDWNGEGTRLVTRAVERERAGTPARAEIDASLAEFNPGPARNWLTGWRERAAPR